MNKLFAVLPLVVALAACNGGDAKPAGPAAPAEAPAAAAPAQTSDSAPAPAPAAAPVTDSTPAASAAPAESTPAVAVVDASARLPDECQAYLDKVSACVAKQSGAAADAMKSAMDQAKASWATMSSRDQVGAACKAASDAFTVQASAMQC